MREVATRVTSWRKTCFGSSVFHIPHSLCGLSAKRESALLYSLRVLSLHFEGLIAIICAMKLWLKYLLGAGVGIVAAVFFSPLTETESAVLGFVVEIAVRFVRYALMPFLFFSVAVGVFRLRLDKALDKSCICFVLFAVLSSAALVALGLASALLFKLPRIPISAETVAEVPTFDWKQLLLKLFPYSGFQSLDEGSYILPCYVFAFLLGAVAASDKTSAKEAVSLFDSLSKVTYSLMSFFIDIFSVAMIAVVCNWAINFVSVAKTGSYTGLFVLLAGDFLFVALVFYPIVMRLFCPTSHPYKILLASVTSLMAAFFTGDSNVALALNLRHGRDALSIRGRSNAFSMPLFSVFARGGSAMVQAVAFVQILRSYSSLGISLSSALWVALLAFALSFVLGGYPTGGSFAAVTAMCLLYGNGFKLEYLLLKNVAPVICAFAAATDCLCSIFGAYFVAHKTKLVHKQDIASI